MYVGGAVVKVIHSDNDDAYRQSYRYDGGI